MFVNENQTGSKARPQNDINGNVFERPIGNTFLPHAHFDIVWGPQSSIAILSLRLNLGIDFLNFVRSARHVACEVTRIVSRRVGHSETQGSQAFSELKSGLNIFSKLLG